MSTLILFLIFPLVMTSRRLKQCFYYFFSPIGIEKPKIQKLFLSSVFLAIIFLSNPQILCYSGNYFSV